MKRTAIICDIDGTLAHMIDRSPYDPTKYHTDAIDTVIREIVNMYNRDRDVILLSGRQEVGRRVTEQWLDDNAVNYTYLYMRADNDNRSDDIVKRELYDEHIKPHYDILFVLDDRDRVVKMWRQQGLKCLQVAEGDF